MQKSANGKQRLPLDLAAHTAFAPSAWSTSLDAARSEEAQINRSGAQTERVNDSSPKADAVTAEQGAVTER